MTSLNKKIRFLPIIGITLTLIGYLFLTLQTCQLNEKKTILNNEIDSLETIKTRLINEAKLKDTIITRQDTIISQSSDTETVKKGVELRKNMKEPNANFFTVTNKKNSNLELAQKFELEGFNYLLAKDVNNAIASFRKSENSANGYHHVYEIASYLNKNKNKLSDMNSAFWKESFQEILKLYSWKMPKDIKLKIAQMTK